MNRKFPIPHNLAAASSPIGMPGEDPINRTRWIENRNGLADNQFLFSVDRMEWLNFNVVAANVPGLNIGEAFFATPYTDVKQPGDKVVFEPLVVRYKVDERLENFLTVQRWIRGLGFPNASEEFKAVEMAHQKFDASLSLPTNGLAMESLRVHFKDVWPTSMEGLDFNSQSDGTELTTTVVFDYATYEIEAVPEGNPTPS